MLTTTATATAKPDRHEGPRQVAEDKADRQIADPRASFV